MYILFCALFLISGIFFVLMLHISYSTLLFPQHPPHASDKEGKDGISIVIPFRNEAPRMPALIESLFNQDYKGPFEIILVNDGSNDDFRASIGPFMQSPVRPVKLVENEYDGHKNLTSKQQAVDSGVAHAAYPYLVFTDADMAFDSRWLNSMASMIPAGNDLVFGHTVIRKSGKNLLHYLQAFQLEFLFAVAYGFHAAKIPGSCMGNNLLLRKKAYGDIGGQSGIGYSIVEDRALLLAFKHRGMKVAPARPFRPLAETYPCETLRDFSSQAFRWARGGFIGNHDLLPAGVLFCFQNALLCMALGGLIQGALANVVFLNLGLTMFFIVCAFGKMRSREHAVLFPVFYVFLLIEITVFLCSCAIRPSLSWKNRKL
jgi:cellulose synthase/poly-beta-1,6-N-acetylglucosamine synthase-like glycosyltransferase